MNASPALRAVRDLGLAGLLGGNLFGRLALHPAVAEISDPAERGKVVNAAWRSYSTVNTLGVVAAGAGWLATRGESDPLTVAGDVLLGVTAAAGLATGFEGMRFAKTAPQGAVPLDDGDHAARQATQRQAQLKQRLNVLGLVTLGAEAALVAVSAAR